MDCPIWPLKKYTAITLSDSGLFENFEVTESIRSFRANGRSYHENNQIFEIAVLDLLRCVILTMKFWPWSLALNIFKHKIFLQMDQQLILNAAHMKGKCFALAFSTIGRWIILNREVGSFSESKITDDFRFENQKRSSNIFQNHPK